MDIRLENGRHIVINAPAVSDSNRYIQSLRVNGQPWNRLTLPHALLAQGATLDFTMGPQPSTWASSETALPPSLTAHGKPLPLHDLIDGGQGEVSSSPDILQLAALSDNDSSTEAALPAVATTISWHFAQPREVAMLTLTSGASAAAPSGWQLQASSDGQHWHTLDTRQHERFAWPHQTRAFAVHAPGSYAYYRLRIDPAAGAAPTALAEIELLGSDAASP
jgi:hypothetical protein